MSHVVVALHSTVPRSNKNYCEPLRLRLREADLDFISRSPDPSLSDPLDRDLDLERSLSSFLDSSFFFSEPERLRLLEAERPDLDLAGEPSLLRLRLRLCLLPDLSLLLLRDLVRDLDLERLRDLFFFLESSMILILRPLSSVSSSLSIAF